VIGRKFFAILAIVLGCIAMLAVSLWTLADLFWDSNPTLEWLYQEGDPVLVPLMLFSISSSTVCSGIAILIPAKEKRS
jgi:hypothetical protein